MNHFLSVHERAESTGVSVFSLLMRVDELGSCLILEVECMSEPCFEMSVFVVQVQ